MSSEESTEKVKYSWNGISLGWLMFVMIATTFIAFAFGYAVGKVTQKAEYWEIKAKGSAEKLAKLDSDPVNQIIEPVIDKAEVRAFLLRTTNIKGAKERLELYQSMTKKILDIILKDPDAEALMAAAYLKEIAQGEEFDFAIEEMFYSYELYALIMSKIDSMDLPPGISRDECGDLISMVRRWLTNNYSELPASWPANEAVIP